VKEEKKAKKGCRPQERNRASVEDKIRRLKQEQEKLEDVLHLLNIQFKAYLDRRLGETNQRLRNLESTRPVAKRFKKSCSYMRRRKFRFIWGSRVNMKRMTCVKPDPDMEATRVVKEEAEEDSGEEGTLVVDESASGDEMEDAAPQNIEIPSPCTTTQHFVSQNLPSDEGPEDVITSTHELLSKIFLQYPATRIQTPATTPIIQYSFRPICLVTELVPARSPSPARFSPIIFSRSPSPCTWEQLALGLREFDD